jgi:universal stress protein E
MRDVPRLLVAIDLHRDGKTLTAGSCLATDQAVELVKHLAAEVVLLHAIGPDWAGARGRESSDAHDSAQHTLDQVADRFRAIGATASVAISDESPWLAIVRRVTRDQIDLVFAGRRNEPSQLPMGLGSVSRQLVRKCPSTVWVAKPGGDLAPRSVLAASDLSPVGERVLEYATFVARHYRAELHVGHAFQLQPGADLEWRIGLEAFMQRVREQRSRQLAEQVERAGGAPSVSIHVVRAAPTNAILELSTLLAPDLVVMGTVSRGRAGSRLVGSTALRLLGRLDCSLLTIKPDDFVCPVAPER